MFTVHTISSPKSWFHSWTFSNKNRKLGIIRFKLYIMFFDKFPVTKNYYITYSILYGIELYLTPLLAEPVWHKWIRSSFSAEPNLMAADILIYSKKNSNLHNSKHVFICQCQTYVTQNTKNCMSQNRNLAVPFVCHRKTKYVIHRNGCVHFCDVMFFCLGKSLNILMEHGQ